MGIDLKRKPTGQLCYTERGTERVHRRRAVCLAAVPGLFKLLMNGRWCREEQSLNCLLGPWAKSPSPSFILIKDGCRDLSVITDLNYKINLQPHRNTLRCIHCQFLSFLILAQQDLYCTVCVTGCSTVATVTLNSPVHGWDSWHPCNSVNFLSMLPPSLVSVFLYVCCSLSRWGHLQAVLHRRRLRLLLRHVQQGQRWHLLLWEQRGCLHWWSVWGTWFHSAVQ